MRTYLVGYDLNKAGQNYDNLTNKIVELAGNNGWWHQLDSTFLIKTNATAMSTAKSLTPYIDSNDELLVVRVTDDAAWYIPNQGASDWLKTHLTTE